MKTKILILFVLFKIFLTEFLDKQITSTRINLINSLTYDYSENNDKCNFYITESRSSIFETAKNRLFFEIDNQKDEVIDVFNTSDIIQYYKKLKNGKDFFL